MRLLLPALLVVGVLLMVPFESPITRVLGMAALIAFVVGGVFAIATPEYLASDDDE
jgi:hypothetical protein